MPFLLRFVNERSQTGRISRGQNNSFDVQLDQFLKHLGVAFAQGVHRTMDELNPERGSASLFVENSSPHLIVEKVNLARDADADASIGSRNGQGASR